jgi:hypothetical protein
VVVLLLCNNDLMDNGKETAWGMYWKPRFVMDGDKIRLERERLPERVPLRQRLARELNRRFVLYEVLGWKLAGFRAARGSARTEPMDTAAATPGNGRSLTRRLILEICSLVASHGGQVLLVVIPPFQAPEILDDLPPSGMGSRLDLEPVLAVAAALHPDSTIGFVHDSHWNARGHRVVAAAIAERIRAKGWLAAAIAGIAPATPVAPDLFSH